MSSHFHSTSKSLPILFTEAKTVSFFFYIKIIFTKSNLIDYKNKNISIKLNEFTKDQLPVKSDILL